MSFQIAHCRDSNHQTAAEKILSFSNQSTTGREQTLCGNHRVISNDRGLYLALGYEPMVSGQDWLSKRLSASFTCEKLQADTKSTL